MIDIDALADELTSAANIVTCDGYYEIDTDAVAQCLSRHLATAQTEAAELCAALRELLDGRKGARERAHAILADTRIPNVDDHIATLAQGTQPHE